MGVLDWPSYRSEAKILRRSIGAAFVIEFFIVTAVGVHERWLSLPQTAAKPVQFIDAEVFTPPPETHLVEEKPIRAPPKPEAVLSKVPLKGKTAKPDAAKTPEENKTQGGRAFAPTHGPVALYAPAPVIPSHLQDENLHSSVVIDFYVTSQGVSTPRLVGSSGNEELDAIAISTAEKWRFHPAENDHRPIDSKVRLRIIFDVR